MFEKFYTTKMSMDKKKLQNRFFKIRNKNSKLSKIISVIILIFVLIAIASASVYFAFKLNKDNEYAMTGDEFVTYVSKPIGAIMPQLDYVDEEKLVFHYLEGFFVIDQQTHKVKHKIDLRKLNVAEHTQGDTVLDVKITVGGKYAFLTSVGTREEEFDAYVIDLDSGKVKTFDDYKESTFQPKWAFFDSYTEVTAPAYEGLVSNGIKVDDRLFYLLYQYGNRGDIKLVTEINMADGYQNTGVRYIFGEEYKSTVVIKEENIQKTLKDFESIVVNSGAGNWNVDGKTALNLHNELSKRLNEPTIDSVFEGNYNIMIYGILNENTNVTTDRLFIINKEDSTVMATHDLDNETLQYVVKEMGENIG